MADKIDTSLGLKLIGAFKELDEAGQAYLSGYLDGAADQKRREREAAKKAALKETGDAEQAPTQRGPK